jgi:hypothetical protein
MAEKLKSLLKRCKKAASHSLADTITIGGITFFSSMMAIGTDNLLLNVKISFISLIIAAGLAFLTDIRSEIVEKE